MIYHLTKCVIHSIANFSVGFANYISEFKNETQKSCICMGSCEEHYPCNTHSYTGYFCPKVSFGKVFDKCQWYTCFPNTSLCNQYISDIYTDTANHNARNEIYLFSSLCLITIIITTIACFLTIMRFSSRARNKLMKVLSNYNEKINNLRGKRNSVDSIASYLPDDISIHVDPDNKMLESNSQT